MTLDFIKTSGLEQTLKRSDIIKFNSENEIEIEKSLQKPVEINFPKNDIKNFKITLKKGVSVKIFWQLSGEYNLKNTLEFDLEKDSKLEVFASYNLKNNAKISHKIKVLHQEFNSKSKIDIRTVLDDQSQLEFNGQIQAQKDSTNTQASLLHKTILLSEKAKITTEPWLIIKHDNLKCSHGATIGSLNQNELFYLQSRGLNKKQATDILIKNFLNPTKNFGL